jgi:hypothetical protein
MSKEQEIVTRPWNVCDLKVCFISGEEREPGPCPHCVINEEGEVDCGYG